MHLRFLLLQVLHRAVGVPGGRFQPSAEFSLCGSKPRRDLVDSREESRAWGQKVHPEVDP